MEQIAAETWRDASDEVVEAAQHDHALRQRAQAQSPEAVGNAEDSEAVQAEPAVSVAPALPQQPQQAAPAPTDLPPVAPQEFAQALRPAHDGGTAAPTVASSMPPSVASSRRTTLRSRSPVPEAVLRAGLMAHPTTAPAALSPATPVAPAAPKTPSAPATPRLGRAVERAKEMTADPLENEKLT